MIVFNISTILTSIRYMADNVRNKCNSTPVRSNLRILSSGFKCRCVLLFFFFVCAKLTMRNEARKMFSAVYPFEIRQSDYSKLISAESGGAS